MIRLIATDLDDTLLDATAALTERTRRALDAAMALGCGITLSSGRMMEAMLPFAERIGVNAPMLLYNGAMIYDHRTDETLFALHQTTVQLPVRIGDVIVPDVAGTGVDVVATANM